MRRTADGQSFEVYDTDTGEVIQPNQPEARRFSAMTWSELTTLTATPGAPVTPSPAPGRPSAGMLTADERKICEAMGISEADFLATRARQPHRWASEEFQ